MAKYMLTASYTPEGTQGLMKDGGTGRKAAVEKLCQSVGGKLEAIYYAFGEDDVFVIADFPDRASAAAVALTVGASGAARVRTTVLLGLDEIDQATKKTVAYQAPGK